MAASFFIAVLVSKRLLKAGALGAEVISEDGSVSIILRGGPGVTRSSPFNCIPFVKWYKYIPPWSIAVETSLYILRMPVVRFKLSE